ncbi:hypothetical protein [Treponema lecithinolyticum]|uniref:Outer membrane-associated lipoprotein TP0453 domain-containing protein n=1 Tax=Treponema lecithinolyticum ATCC 700332 TaxID=1321815 RepID=A0ABN0NZW7_TRELE|nr:hypothetical protein [Treponema lecithinolyticum]ERJ93575.1 hypothetical protein HMPREF9193_00864 [Treponema lecithinolyticum ATCC 700332]
MKKHNSLLCIAALCVLFLVLYTVSCKTVPAAPAADMFTLFDSDADLYLRIPVRSNEAFVSALARAWLPSLDARSLQKLMKRTSVLYAAFFVQQKDKGKTDVLFQLAAEGSYPALFFTAALSKKNGWTNEFQTEKDKVYPHKNWQYGIEAANPDSAHIFISNKAVFPMQKKYSRIFTEKTELALNWPSLNDEQGNPVPVRSLLNEPEKAAFYMSEAGTLLPAMAGAPITLAIEFAVGTVQPYKNDYALLHMRLQMSDERASKIAAKLFRFAVLGTNLKVSEQAGNILEIDNLVVEPSLFAGFIQKK